jgi:hypothetical protein
MAEPDSSSEFAYCLSVVPKFRVEDIDPGCRYTNLILYT